MSSYFRDTTLASGHLAGGGRERDLGELVARPEVLLLRAGESAYHLAVLKPGESRLVKNPLWLLIRILNRDHLAAPGVELLAGMPLRKRRLLLKGA